ncbi:MAG: alpha/beta hydrolase [Oscillibacter sp.]|nr:alpha/beta hydrolase [Oscillospiraceae bacterium]MBR0280637.1 alpha/beta hydrolase [Oscillibacter sp.]
MSANVKEKKGRALFVGLCVLVFLLAFGAGVVSKFAIAPSWSKEYSVVWSDEIGTLKADLSYGDGDANKFDLYLPKDNGKGNYGLAVYLHAGGFTMGDKADDRNTLAWLCSKGYVAAGINYTLRTETNEASVLSQSNEIKAAVPKVIEAAEAFGYHIDKLTMAGGSAGHALAMIYAYRDAKESPVPVVFTYGAVGPSSFYQEDWGIFGLDRNDEACALLFSVMAGVEISAEEIRDGSYLEKVKPIAAAEWVNENSAPTVVAYGTHDRAQPFLASLRLKSALEENGVDFRYFECTHSGHGLQNDGKISRQWMEAVVEYLGKYMPI